MLTCQIIKSTCQIIMSTCQIIKSTFQIIFWLVYQKSWRQKWAISRLHGEMPTYFGKSNYLTSRHNYVASRLIRLICLHKYLTSRWQKYATIAIKHVLWLKWAILVHLTRFLYASSQFVYRNCKTVRAQTWQPCADPRRHVVNFRDEIST